MNQKASYLPIDCSDHDRLEIACLDRYNVALQTDDGEILGRAQTTTTDASGEYLSLLTDSGDLTRVRLDCIRRMTVLSRPCRFEDHEFSRA